MQKFDRGALPSSEFQKKKMYMINWFVKEKLQSTNVECAFLNYGCIPMLEIKIKFNFENYFSMTDKEKIIFYESFFDEEEKKQHNEKLRQYLM